MTSCRGPAPAMTRLVSDHRLLVWQAASLGVPGKDGLDGKDGVGVAEVQIQEGDLVLTMSDGTVINAGSIVTENRVSPETQKSVPWWIIFVLIGWNTLLTAGFIALAVANPLQGRGPPGGGPLFISCGA